MSSNSTLPFAWLQKMQQCQVIFFHNLSLHAFNPYKWFLINGLYSGAGIWTDVLSKMTTRPRRLIILIQSAPFIVNLKLYLCTRSTLKTWLSDQHNTPHVLLKHQENNYIMDTIYLNQIRKGIAASYSTMSKVVKIRLIEKVFNFCPLSQKSWAEKYLRQLTTSKITYLSS